MNGMRYMLISIAAVLVAACGSGIEPKQGHIVKIQEELNSEGQNFQSNKSNGISLREAYLKYVHPVVKKHCSGCHIHTDEGAHPFAGTTEEVVVAAAGRLIGSKLSESRFYIKVSDEEVPHPNKEVAENALPELIPALEAFFAAVAELGDGIATEDLRLTSAKADLPQVNPSGWLIFEAEGAQIQANTKFQTVLGVYSNGKGVGSNNLPNHPVSGTARTYNTVTYTNQNSNACTDARPNISQIAHVDGGLGIAKYVISLDATVLGADRFNGKNGLSGGNGQPLRVGNNGVVIDNVIRILPYNIEPGQPVSDTQYKNYTNPNFNTSCTFEPGAPCISGTPGSNYVVTVGDVTFSEKQIDHLIAVFKDQRNQVDDNDVWRFDKFLFGEPVWCNDARGANASKYYDVWINRLCDASGVQSISAELASNKAAIFKYIRLSSDQRIAGQVNIRYRRWNASRGERLYRIRSNFRFDVAHWASQGWYGTAEPNDPVGGDDEDGTFNVTVHQNQSINTLDPSLSWFQPGEKNPGVATFAFKVPADLKFADIQDEGTLPFRMYYRGTDPFNLRIKKLSDGSYINITNNSNCITITPGAAWSHRSDQIQLEKGESYSMELLQSTQNTVVDVFALVVDSELNEDLVANPNTNPTVLRQKFYGIGGKGVQEKTYFMSWPLDFGRIQMEIVNAEGFYAIENPIFYMDAAHRDMNVSVKGFTFRTNGNVALTDRSFEVDAVRVPGQNATYGQVLIPKDKGFNEDSLGVVFSRLEATDEPGTLPVYEEGPPLEGQYCMAPDVFKEWLWPVYSQQKIMLRDEYANWKGDTYPARYTAGNADNDPEVDLPELPTVYTCTGCHNIDHPYMQLEASDYLVSCDLIIARTNLAQPELSFSLRGLRGQFNHLPMWTMFDPWNGQSLRKFDMGNGVSRIWGPMNGALGSYDYNEVMGMLGLNDAQKLNALTSPAQIGFTEDLDFNIPLYQNGAFVYSNIKPDNVLYNNNNLSTWLKNNTDNMDSQHTATIQKWIEYGFKRWVNAEKAARGN